jgi:NAD+ synthase
LDYLTGSKVLTDFDKLKIDEKKTVEVLSGFIKNELKKAGLNNLVLGISGGLDSAVVATISVKAIGAENVTGVMMPYKTSSSENLKDAEAFIEKLEIEKFKIKITSSIDNYFVYFPDADPNRRGNKMARERMSVLYDISAMKNALVIGTSNKSEILLGYGTIFGDLSCAINPIGDLYKTQVRQLAAYLGVPENIINKVPSADLVVGQSDEGDFGFLYSEVDRLFYYLVDEGISPADCVDIGFSKEFISKVISMINANQFKRSTPKIAQISSRPITSDFRIEPF